MPLVSDSAWGALHAAYHGHILSRQSFSGANNDAIDELMRHKLIEAAPDSATAYGISDLGAEEIEKGRVTIDPISVFQGAQVRHHSERRYTVMAVANGYSTNSEKFPPTVVYVGVNGKIWSRPMDQFIRKFREIED